MLIWSFFQTTLVMARFSVIFRSQIRRVLSKIENRFGLNNKVFKNVAVLNVVLPSSNLKKGVSYLSWYLCFLIMYVQHGLFLNMEVVTRNSNSKENVIFMRANKNSKKQQRIVNNNYNNNNSNKNNNNKDSLLKSLIPLLLVILLIIDYNALFTFLKQITLVMFIKFYIWVLIFLMLDPIINVVFIILFYYKIVTIPPYLPSYIQNWLIKRKDWSSKDVIRAYLDLEIRDIVSFLFTILLAWIFAYHWV